MQKFNPINPTRKKCRSCGHEMLTDDEKRFLLEDARPPIGTLIRDALHNNISQEDAELLVPYVIGMGVVMMEESMRHGSDIKNHVIMSGIAQNLTGKK